MAYTTVGTTVEPRFNDLRFNNIPSITTNIRFPGKSYSKRYGTEPQFNVLRFKDMYSQYNDKHSFPRQKFS